MSDTIDTHAVDAGHGTYTSIRALITMLDEDWEGWDAEEGTAHPLADEYGVRNTFEVRDRIMETPLSVLVWGGWHTPGESGEAEEYEILLSTGGPAVRIYGKLNRYGEPGTAELQVQDWFTPWTTVPFETDEDTLLAFACEFYFEE